jgi:probable HAF family extracellular repeat protein
VGAADTAGGQSHAFLYAGGGYTDLGTFGGDSSVANAINNQGVVVGNATSDAPSSSYFPQAFRYANGSLQALGTLPDSLGSYAYAINNSGLIGGASHEGGFTVPEYPYYAVTYANGGVQQLGGVSYQGQSAIYGLNDAGLAVGAIAGGNFSHSSHAFLYEGGTVIDLGVFDAFADDSRAYDINNLGQIVGSGAVNLDESHYGYHGFLYQNGGFVDLNTLIDPALDLEITSAAAINDASQIAATACVGGQMSGNCYAVRLDLVPAVPEPGSWAMLALGLGLAGARKGLTRRT